MIAPEAIVPEPAAPQMTFPWASTVSFPAFANPEQSRVSICSPPVSMTSPSKVEVLEASMREDCAPPVNVEVPDPPTNMVEDA